jgi:hypothetical protein
MIERKVVDGRSDEAKSELRKPSQAFDRPLRFARSTEVKGLQPSINNKGLRHELTQYKIH